MCVSIYFTNHFQVALLEFIIKGLGKFNSDLKEVLCLPCHVKLNKQEFGFLVKFENTALGGIGWLISHPEQKQEQQQQKCFRKRDQ